MTQRQNKDLKARAEAAFRNVLRPAPSDVGNKETSVSINETQAQSRPVETTEGAMDEYRARQEAERAKMAKLKALRMAAEAKSGVKATVKRKSGKARR